MASFCNKFISSKLYQLIQTQKIYFIQKIIIKKKKKKKTKSIWRNFQQLIFENVLVICVQSNLNNSYLNGGKKTQRWKIYIKYAVKPKIHTHPHFGAHSQWIRYSFECIFWVLEKRPASHYNIQVNDTNTL